ncbi:imidazoleglycerol-phosphate dehydratase HisB [cf. Phormidesmis sp. LEGE 11477]|uniref:imidazoleglycerol-phosphate dehydratase HisB n=1 Tax=cf. Phormidesmis sp. LEGE 11477 TaxID=1828680 RepID=UPI001882189C|nr:imidazoleglycerol-phosphate dehydratase HisB [cf. Phormidesmis sp. LEGE 11477]MBE9063727.1 imidazoleglycerol-phosphate dehydratase HisB [cf. Phormidesmis sp. LEGE 11477]
MVSSTQSVSASSFSTAASHTSASHSASQSESLLDRTASVSRTTKETDVQVTLNVDGTGKCTADTGVPFLDHMLHQIASHGLFDLEVRATGDIEIDDHHTNEDVGITLGMALRQALGDRKGITRFGHFIAPLDEALVQISLDFSGRPHLSYGLDIPTQRVGTYDTQLVREFFVAIINHAQMTLHIRQLDGINSHHIIEATFKAFARAMRMATEVDPRRAGKIPSSKGVL